MPRYPKIASIGTESPTGQRAHPGAAFGHGLASPLFPVGGPESRIFTSGCGCLSSRGGRLLQPSLLSLGMPCLPWFPSRGGREGWHPDSTFRFGKSFDHLHQSLVRFLQRAPMCFSSGPKSCDVQLSEVEAATWECDLFRVPLRVTRWPVSVSPVQVDRPERTNVNEEQGQIESPISACRTNYASEAETDITENEPAI
ncbi:hypothetical protein AFLA_007606 [Aspergillus flavus NRRL3357]|nr:hypothetical protein AFLA_007606 [Aspergillus flavus NRRL3357]